MGTVAYTFYADYTGLRRANSRYPAQVGIPIGFLYTLPYDTTNLNMDSIDRSNLSFGI